MSHLSYCSNYGIQASLGTSGFGFVPISPTVHTFVSINGFQSTTIPVISGVPQGSIYGPLLFILFINDLSCSVTSSFILMFIDVTKCLNIIYSFSETLDFQYDFIALGASARKWNLYFNETQCVHLRFLPNSHPAPQQSYSISNSTISLSNFHHDLRVFLSSDLSWSNHHYAIISRAYKSLGGIRRTFNTSCVSTKRQLYLSLIRSQLSYCSPIWRPHLTKSFN